MRVVGVDPGLARVGVAVVDGGGGALHLVHATCITTEPGDGAARLHALDIALSALLAEHRPQAAAVEELFFATNRRSAMRVAEARGVLLCAVARAGLPVTSYTPLQVKEAVAGYGAAEKRQVARMVRALLGVASVEGPDVADACAVAICHHHRHRLAARAGAAAGAGAGGGRPTPRLAAAVQAALEAAAAGRPAR